ncbi:haloacid dehalogenase superfamily enzyme, subfamily IA [Xenococcus sp. PCC 7305]|uniref:HAD family hydrolase n=1 Tax=Xenococcus sp. PCC 7305 TaxID=102125 RepID=UPI0002ACFB4D|nr:HAD family hydrolase [Xenococcus sp. PCC 7305]ELS04208.1 haloacid dehalogenase superfamily enzyme, subfamily IA [Xenococcus sp. PCC 7305]
MITITCKDKIFTDIEAIFFDKDGTIEDSRLYLHQLATERLDLLASHHMEIASYLSQAFGIDLEKIDPKGLMAVGSRQENELAAAAYIASSGCGWYQAQEIAYQAFESAANNIIPTKKTSPIFPGALGLFEQLITAQCQLGIISADSLSGIKKFVAREKIQDYFKVLIGSDRNIQKPDPKLYLKACQSLNVQPQNTLMVGDSVGDIIMAQQAGAAGTIGICWENIDTEHLSQANVTITHLEDIKILDKPSNYLIV